MPLLYRATMETEWTTYGFAEECSFGFYDDLAVRTGYLDTAWQEHAVIWSLWEVDEFPRTVISIFKNKFLPHAACARCGEKAGELRLAEHPSRKLGGKETFFVACSCGYPVWRIGYSEFSDVCYAILRAGYSRKQKAIRHRSGGKSSASERRALLALQQGRCLYCDKEFGPDCRPTRDHLLPISDGGDNWAWNLVFACMKCNRHRWIIPFRTYCTLLSKTQNKRILAFLRKRLACEDAGMIDGDGFQTFVRALRRHNVRDECYREILRRSARRRRYAESNALLPTAAQLLRRIRSDAPLTKIALPGRQSRFWDERNSCWVYFSAKAVATP